MSKKAGVIAAVVVICAAAAAVVKFCFLSDSVAVSNNNDNSSDSKFDYNMEVSDSEYGCRPIYINYSNDLIHSGNLILVNRDYEYTSTNENLVSLSDVKNESYSVSSNEMKLDSVMAQQINSMLSDFEKATGNNDVMANSGFRSIDEQKELYDDDLERTQSDTSELVAPPGHSEHHTGYAMDFAIDDGYYPALKNEGDYSWIYDNADKYGMFLRYTEENKEVTKYMAESWHFRYVGAPHASIIKKLGMPYENYIDFIKEFSYDAPFEYKYSDTESYSIYYVPADTSSDTTSIPVSVKAALSPQNDEYTISGNNVDGFIVTMKIDRVSSDYNEDLLEMYAGMYSPAKTDEEAEQTQADSESEE